MDLAQKPKPRYQNIENKIPQLIFNKSGCRMTYDKNDDVWVLTSSMEIYMDREDPTSRLGTITIKTLIDNEVVRDASQATFEELMGAFSSLHRDIYEALTRTLSYKNAVNRGLSRDLLYSITPSEIIIKVKRKAGY